MSNHLEYDDFEDEQIPTICSICHNEPPTNAVQLDCNHIFCFPCIKSVSETTGLCPLCRTEIGIEFNFQEHRILGALRVPYSEDGNYWFYEGYKGWWLYDAETNREIENAYRRGDQRVQRYIAGAIYLIDLVNMTQRREDGDGRLRKVCRQNLQLENILGMGGIRGEDFKDMLEMMRMNVPNSIR